MNQIKLLGIPLIIRVVSVIPVPVVNVVLAFPRFLIPRRASSSLF